MPSLRKRVSSYLRQLSFHNENRDRRHNVNENSFITKYLQGYITLREGPPIIYGKIPTDLPNYELGAYETGHATINGCYSGPNGGLTTVKRAEKHLSVLDADIDFIDTQDENALPTSTPPVPRKSPQRVKGQPVDNATMMIKVAGQEYCVTNRTKRHNKSHSLGSITDFDLEIEKTKIDRDFYNSLGKQQKGVVANNNNNNNDVTCATKSDVNVDDDTRNRNVDIQNNATKRSVKEAATSKVANGSRRGVQQSASGQSSAQKNYSLAKSKSEGNPFDHKKRGKIIKVAQRANSAREEEKTDEQTVPTITVDDTALPPEWNRKSNTVYGISDSLYDRNQVTNNKNGDPIADCFGVISRGDSAILAVADGVNWGEKAAIAAKSAIHGCLHYLNKTIFSDTKPFENLTVKVEDSSGGGGPLSTEDGAATFGGTRVSNTREIFVCLLRAFSCAHDLILENKGMLTTLTVAVVLPLKQRGGRRYDDEDGDRRKSETITRYVACVCNVGDTLAYVYSQKYGLRELTKGSHDVSCNRDMRDALGALGPVDGISPELSNLTLSITTLQRGDIVLVASDGLTDNFDPNVCRFTVNSHMPEPPRTRKTSTGRTASSASASTRTPAVPAERTSTSAQTGSRVPQKPPRRSRGSTSSRTGSSKSSTPSVETPVEEIEVPPLRKTGDHDDDVENNPLVAQFIKDNAVGVGDKKKSTVVVENKASSLRRQVASGHQGRKTQSTKKAPSDAPPQVQGYKFLRSKTTIEVRNTAANFKQILRNEDGIPFVTPIQRYELQLLLMEDVLKNGISGRDSPCTTARKLCESLVSFTFSISSAKRHTLEDQELYFDNRNGLLVEVSQHEKKIRRKRGLEKVQNLPGKLDHVSVVAWNVGHYCIGA